MKNKIWKILLSVVLAFGLWLYVITVVSPGSEKTYYDIPVILQNEAILQREGLMITAIEDDSVTLQLEGNRTDLDQLNESNINIFANLSGVVSAGTHRINYDINFPGSIASNAVTTQSKVPDMLTITVENRVTRQIPVEVVYVGAVPENYIADKENLELEFPMIEVKGAESQVTKISSCRIRVDLNGKTASISEEFPYAFYDEAGKQMELNEDLVTTNVKETKGKETIQLYLNIKRYKEVPLTVTVVPGGGATKDTCTIVIAPEKIGISGNESQLESLKELNLGTLELADITADETFTFPIQLPEGITNLSGLSEATVSVQFPELQTKTMRVTNLEAINIPENMKLEYLTKEVEITVRGPIKVVRLLKESDIKLVVDLADAQSGTLSLPATVVMTDANSAVGAMGSYNVTVTLTRDTQRP